MDETVGLTLAAPAAAAPHDMRGTTTGSAAADRRVGVAPGLVAGTAAAPPAAAVGETSGAAAVGETNCAAAGRPATSQAMTITRETIAAAIGKSGR
ncbi:MAG: hypothetical protein ACXWMX_01330 [Candidatus Limnocylindrales bacterium]